MEQQDLLTSVTMDQENHHIVTCFPSPCPIKEKDAKMSKVTKVKRTNIQHKQYQITWITRSKMSICHEKFSLAVHWSDHDTFLV